MKHLDQYKKLSDQGIVPVNTGVEYNDVIIGQTTHLRHNLGTTVVPGTNKKIAIKKKRRDTSLIYPFEQPATVSHSIIGINYEGTQLARLQTRETRFLLKGDKGSTDAGQKATVSFLIENADLLELANGTGLNFEYFVNNQALPKRMTCAMPIEMVFSLAVALGYLRFSEATGFRDQMNNQAELIQVLRKHGFSICGSKIRCGRTGKLIQAFVFCGFVRYAKLKHMQLDKLHSRARGPVNFLTRQPTEGKQKMGGLRFGEMERSCAAAYAAACVTHQLTHEVTDAYRISICPACHYFAVTPAAAKRSYCQKCKERNMLSTNISYSYKILTQLLMSLLIFPQPHMTKLPPPQAHLIESFKDADLV